jgi:hypothetical protein
MSPTRDSVVSAIKQSFPHENPATVLAVLDRYGVEPYERERERVQLAVLKLSEGNIERLRHYIEAAETDYRDVLYWAEYSTQG